MQFCEICQSDHEIKESLTEQLRAAGLQDFLDDSISHAKMVRDHGETTEAAIKCAVSHAHFREQQELNNGC